MNLPEIETLLDNIIISISNEMDSNYDHNKIPLLT